MEIVKEGHQAILQRAAATGLINEESLEGDGDKPKVKTKKSKSKNKKKSSATSSHSRRRNKKSSSPKRIIAFGTSSSSDLKQRSTMLNF